MYERTTKLDGHPNINVIHEKFAKSCSNYKLDKCAECNGRSLCKKNLVSLICERCTREKRTHVGISCFSKDNDLDPYKDGYPHHLPTLSDIEEIIISKVFVVMRVYRLKGSGSVGYKGNVLNIEQDLNEQVESICVSLPRLPTELPYLVIRKDSCDTTGFKDFKININKIREWLVWLQDNNPLYSGCLSEANVDRYNQLSDEPGDVDLSQYLNLADDIDDNSDGAILDDLFINDEVLNGPEQGCASGNNLSNIEEGHLYLPADSVDNNIQSNMIRQLLVEKLGTNMNPIRMIPGTNILNDFSTPSLQCLAFPTLFPYGEGDVTRNSRIYEVTLIESIKHLLNYAVADPSDSNTYFYPFVIHNRWMHWAQNTAKRHRIQGQQNMYMSRNADTATLNESDLRRLIDNNNPQLDVIIRNMQTYNGNINGSSSYFYKKRLEAEGSPTCWYTFTAADNFWADLHKLISPSATSQYEDMTEIKQLRIRKRMIARNPHIVDEYFTARFNDFFKSYFSLEGLNAKWNWYRIEYQARGTAHVHGCVRLNSDPGCTVLGEKVLEGRVCERELSHRNLSCDRSRNSLNTYNFVKDKWATDEELEKVMGPLEFSRMLTHTGIGKYKEIISEGIRVEEKLAAYNDFFNYNC